MRIVARLTSLWEEPPGVLGWLSTVDHKKLGKRYLVTAFLFLLVGGVEALLMRLQLTRSDARVFTPEEYAQLFTMHGMTMIWWYAAPILSGFGIYCIPLMIGSRDLAYPRLNAMSYWTFLFSGIFLYISPLVGEAPRAGWFAYVPLTEAQYSPGWGMDFYALALIFLTISTTAGAVNLVVTILHHRAPGMAVSRMPLFLYSTLTANLAAIFSLPSLTAACVFLELDRRWHFKFFDVHHGGDAVLWQHLFWFFGHPWVYVIFLPATGIISMCLPVFARRPIVGYPFVAIATVITGIVGFGVWVHHMFSIGMSQMSMSFFSAASMTISIASTVQVFAWVATLWRGRPVLTTSMLFAVSFIIVLVIGGLSGVVTAVVPFDWQLTDTYFVVAHIHYVLVGANMLPVFAGLYYWLPKITGRKNNEWLGRISWALVFGGLNLAFLPMHINGLLGMPRRIYTYLAIQGWDSLNLIETIGAGILGLGVLVSVFNWLWSARHGAVAGKNPWNADTLEWETTSPPPVYGSAHIPQVVSRHPLWDEYEEELDPLDQRVLDEERFTFSTSSIDANIRGISWIPKETITPLLWSLDLAGVFVALLFARGWVAAGIALLGALLNGIWLWPQSKKLPSPPLTEEERAQRGPPLTTHIDHRRGTFAMVLFIGTEAALFVAMFFAYYYLAPFPGEHPPSLWYAFFQLGCAVVAFAACLVATTLATGGASIAARVMIALAVVACAAFLVLQGFDFALESHFTLPQSGSYGSIFFTIVGVHALHVVVGGLFLLWALVLPRLERAVLKNITLYWAFILVVYAAVWLLLYVIPHARGTP